MEQVRPENVSKKKLATVQSASFDTMIAALTAKSENAQVTFFYRLLGKLSGEVLATVYTYAEKEIRRRVRNATVKDAKAAGEV